MRQRHEAEHEVVAEQDPRRQGRAREDRDLLALHLAEDVVEEDERRNGVQEVEQRRARREELLKPHFPP
ncbi:MAG: hypothetical protein M3R57_05290, partial [Chloroflexota bacterium]|nr:hypothetical protein [Chloroflexota bacterium]